MPPDWETYGWPSRAICANIEGAGHAISNLWGRPDPNSDGPRTGIGLFDILHYNFVRNLNIEYDSSKMATAPEETFVDRLAFSGDYGGLSTHSDHSHISNVHATGNFHMGGQVAGIVAWPAYSTIEHCSFEGNLSGSNVGGIASYSAASNIRNCFFKGTIAALGGGGIADRPVADGETEYSENVAIITDLKELDIGIFADYNNPWGTFFAQMVEASVNKFHLKSNYVLNVEDYPFATMNLGDRWSIGGETFPVEFTEDEVKGFDDIAAFSDPNNLSALDFENHWYMDEELGEPRLKKKQHQHRQYDGSGME